jgi:acyl-CoA thioesterase
MSAATLAILGDYVPFGIGQALGARAGGNSLDNTLRVGTLVASEWVLLDIRIDAIANGFGHGVVHLWAQDGTLLASASQSTMVRYWPD